MGQRKHRISGGFKDDCRLRTTQNSISATEIKLLPQLFYLWNQKQVVDGLPAEFVLGRGGQLPPTEMLMAMPYTQKLLTSGRALGFHAKAAPPTVTMPRLKAMTSGAIAGFLDVAFNFNTQALLGDNLITGKGRLANGYAWR